jgi:hypothetical protein
VQGGAWASTAYQHSRSRNHSPEPGPADSGDCERLLLRRYGRENSAAQPQPRPVLPCAAAGAEWGRARARTDMCAKGGPSS